MIRFVTAFLITLSSFCWVPEYTFSKDNKPKKKLRKNQFILSSWYRVYPDVDQKANTFFALSPPKSVLTNYTGQQVSFAYQRTICKSFSVGAQYTYWRANNDLWAYQDRKPPNDRIIGWSYMRWAYQHYDLLGTYRQQVYERHSVAGSVGISYSYGWDLVLDNYYKDPNLSYVSFYWGKPAMRSYWSGIVMLNYDYSMWRGRCSVGLNANFRSYRKSYWPMYNAGLHASVNF
jgi:hypothetical protein